MTLTRILVFVGVLTALTGLLHYYVWARFVRDMAYPAPWSRVGTVLAVVLALLPVASMLSLRFVPRSISSPLSWVAMTWLGLLFLSVVSLVVADAVRLLFFGLRGGSLADPERRTFLARLIGGTVAIFVTIVGGVGMGSALSPIRLRHVRIPLGRLPEKLSGYTIVQLTDIHVGPTIGKAFIERLVEQSNRLHPDMIVITGDLVDGSVTELGAMVQPLAQLRAKDGVYFVTGNHEYYSGVDDWLAFLSTLGIRVLRNERVAIRGADGFDLLGIDDFRASDFGGGHGADLSKALAGRDPGRVAVLLAHQPKAVIEAALHQIDLQLSGHTHGGQLFPFRYLVALDQPVVSGLRKIRETWIYVSRGAGYWGPPMRVAEPPEVTRVELVRA